MSARVLYLLRHATAATHASALRDLERPLTDEGHAEARDVGRFLAHSEPAVAKILCSPARRTRETTAGLGLAAPVAIDETLYNAGSDYLRRAIGLVDDDVACLLVVAHAPGVPALAHELLDAAASAPEAVAEIASYYPSATLVRLECDGPWADIALGDGCARLTLARRPG